MLNHLLERSDCRPPRGVARRRRRGGWAEHRGPGRAPGGVQAGARAAGVALRSAGRGIEKRLLMPYGQNTVHVTYRLLEGTGPVRLALRPSIQFRGYEPAVDTSLADVLHVDLLRRAIRSERRARTFHRCACSYGERAALTLDEKGAGDIPYEMERSRGYASIGSLWSPGYFRADLRRRPRGHAGRVDRAVGSDPCAVARGCGGEPRHERRRRLIAIAGPAGEDPFGAELVLAADQFIITPAGRAEEAARARAAGEEVRTVIAGYHWFTDWGRDTMISLEGLTLTTRPIPRGGLHPAHLRPLHPRRADPEHVPRRGARGALSHRRRDAVVLPRPAALSRRDRRRRTVRQLMPKLTECGRASSEGTKFGIAVDRGRRPAPPGRAGLSADLDGREGRRLGRHAAARQGGGDQRALVQRAPSARRMGTAAWRRRRRSRTWSITPPGPASRSTGGSGCRRRLSVRRGRW